MVIFKNSFYDNLCVMCTSKNCQGSCHTLLKNNEPDLKESLAQIITGLDNISTCTVGKAELKNTTAYNTMSELNELKTEAKRLLEEVNCYADKFSHANTKCNSFDISENVFEEYSFKERIKQLKQKTHLLESPFTKRPAVC